MARYLPSINSAKIDRTFSSEIRQEEFMRIQRYALTAAFPGRHRARVDRLGPRRSHDYGRHPWCLGCRPERQRSPLRTAGYLSGSLVAEPGPYVFKYLNSGNSININEFWVGSSRAAAVAAGDFFCTKATTAGDCAGGITPSGKSFSVNLSAGDVPFTFQFAQNSDGTGEAPYQTTGRAPPALTLLRSASARRPTLARVRWRISGCPTYPRPTWTTRI